MTAGRYLQVALNTPLNRLFDYRAPAAGATVVPGMRVRVPFGRRQLVGVVVACSHTTAVPSGKLKTADELLDRRPLLDPALLELLLWASDYYQHPPGEVIAAALPTALRQGGDPRVPPEAIWRATAAGHAAGLAALPANATAQSMLFEALLAGDALTAAELRTVHAQWRKPVSTLVERGWVEKGAASAAPAVPAEQVQGPELTPAQTAAIAGVPASGFHTCLLEGVTGSGKTEVYLRLIETQLRAGRQTLVLVPEIGLTPQLLARFTERLPVQLAVLHSGLTDTQRLHNWVAARDGTARVIIGTRSAIFVPLPEAGLLIVDEEHDGSFKQQDGFRYSARDLAVWRGRQLGIPVVLGSATPALETLHNARSERYIHLHLPERPGRAEPPVFKTVDLRVHPPTDGLSQPLLDALRRHLTNGDQAIVYLNRRGFAPTLLCPECGTIQECDRCDARLVLHQRRRRLACHHCGSERPQPDSCPDCSHELVPVGQGTERLEQALTETFPDYPLVRIDRDTTRRRGALEAQLERVRAGDARLLVGTQMLTKGHDFPDVTCVGIVDADQGLFGTDFRASERLAQAVIQVAGRAGRGTKAGEVWLQSWAPEHPLLRTLIDHGYGEFAGAALDERRLAGWPPFSHLTLLRVESAGRDQLFGFLNAARDQAMCAATPGLRLLGPAAAPMEKRSGRYRGQLLITAAKRGELQRFLPRWRAQLDGLTYARRVRWSIDVDPFDLF